MTRETLQRCTVEALLLLLLQPGLSGIWVRRNLEEPRRRRRHLSPVYPLRPRQSGFCLSPRSHSYPRFSSFHLCSLSLAHRVLHRRTRSVPTVTSLPYYVPQSVFDKYPALKVPHNRYLIWKSNERRRRELKELQSFERRSVEHPTIQHRRRSSGCLEPAMFDAAAEQSNSRQLYGSVSGCSLTELHC